MCLQEVRLHQTAPQDRDGGQDQAKLPVQGPDYGDPRYKFNKELTLLITNNS